MKVEKKITLQHRHLHLIDLTAAADDLVHGLCLQNMEGGKSIATTLLNVLSFIVPLRFCSLQ